MITNSGNIALPMAVWLAADDYDLVPKVKTISATTLLKPIKSLVLSQAIAEQDLEIDIDVEDLIASRVGTAVHSAVQNAWENHLESALIQLGLPKKARELVRLNPELPLDPNNHNVFIELRSTRELNGWTISGKFDLVENGQVEDVKTTSVWNWMLGSNDAKYALQGSIYRWLNPKLITEDTMKVHFIFTDWKAAEYTRKKKDGYPPRKIMTRTLPLKSLAEIESFISSQIRKLEIYLGKPESVIPPCTPEELWQKPTKWAYYANYENMGKTRATKVFDSSHDALQRQMLDNPPGAVEKRPGEVKFCPYCPAYPICQQAESYVQQGILKI